MAINFPDSPTANVTTHTVGDVIYTFDGDKWVAAQQPITPPDVTSVALAEAAGNANRFTSSQFTVTPTLANDGNPASAKDLKLKLGPVVTAQAASSAITNVGTASFADSVQPYTLNANNWQCVRWCGPPFNCYVACADGGNTNLTWGKSTDGKTWTTHAATGFTTNITQFCYHPNHQRIYIAYATTLYGCDTDDFNFNESWSMPNLNSNTFGWHNITYNPDDDSMWATWSHWANPSWAKSVPGGSVSQNSSWTTRGATSNQFIQRSKYNRGNGSMTAIGVGNHPPSYNVGCLVRNPTDSNWSNQAMNSIINVTYSNYHHLGVIDRYVFVGDSSKNIYVSNSNNPGSTDWTSYDAANIDSNITQLRMQCGEYVDTLGIFVFFGAASHSVHGWIGAALWTTNGTTWNINYTATNTLYQWSDCFWDDDNSRMVLVANSAGINTSRAGITSTVYQNVNMPELTFVSESELAAFSVGQSITQANGNASGTIADIDTANRQVIVSGSTGTWATGQTVDGASASYTEGYLVMDSNGNVTDISPTDPGYTRMNGDGPFTITFPAAFNNGDVPDTALPANSTIQADFRAISTTQGFIGSESAESTTVTPT